MHGIVGRTKTRATKPASKLDHAPGKAKISNQSRQTPLLFLPELHAKSWPPPSELTGNAIRDAVVANGRKHGVEFLISVDGNGQLVESIKGSRKEVDLTSILRSALLNPASRLTIHHNHPGGGVLSPQDLAMLIFPGANVIYAHTSDQGPVYTCRARLSAAGRNTVDTMFPSWGGIEHARSLLILIMRTPRANRSRVLAEIQRGAVDESEANYAGMFIDIEAAKRSGLFVVDHNFPVPTLLRRKDFQLAINILSEDIARIYRTTAGQVDHPIEDFRHAAGLELVPSEPVSLS